VNYAMFVRLILMIVVIVLIALVFIMDQIALRVHVTMECAMTELPEMECVNVTHILTEKLVINASQIISVFSANICALLARQMLTVIMGLLELVTVFVMRDFMGQIAFLVLLDLIQMQHVLNVFLIIMVLIVNFASIAALMAFVHRVFQAMVNAFAIKVGVVPLVTNVLQGMIQRKPAATVRI